MKEINSYPSIYAIGHPAVRNIFNGPVLIEEKVDGSQFSFGVIGGELYCRSKGKMLVLDEPEKMFAAGVEAVKAIADHLTPEWIYRAEYLKSPKHNTLTYTRAPSNHIALFDVQVGQESYLTSAAKCIEAMRIGVDCVTVLGSGVFSDFNSLIGLLDRESFLGGTKIEGFVVKNYAQFGPDKKVLMGKYVSEAFKERHAEEWKKSNPTGKDIVQAIIAGLRTEARWVKSIQHLQESGEIEGSPRDIGKLIKEITRDVRDDSEDEIRDALMRHFWPQIQRGITAGFPEFYKRYLAERSFDA